jgi:putative Mg2+ transporter-C (MgtC) family protein
VDPSNLDLAGRLLLAILLGGLVGLERELTGKVAGVRTHISVALGACLFGIVSAYAFRPFGVLPRDESSYQVDVTRVASQVVVGIGFLGGGAILKLGGSVRGLTTAGSLWVTAAIGLAVAFGELFLSVVATAALLVTLAGLRLPVRSLRRVLHERGSVQVILAPHADVAAVIDALYALPAIEVRSLTLRRLDDRRVVQADVTAPPGHDVESTVMALAERPDVEGVEVE